VYGRCPTSAAPESSDAPAIVDRTVVFSTRWFDVVAKTVSGSDPGAPFYSVSTDDYVAIVATTERGDTLLVRQYRPAVERFTLELPAGHVDAGESPLEAASRELLEETGYRAATIEHLGTLIPDTGRLGNKLWCFYAAEATLAREVTPREAGVALVVLDPPTLTRSILDGELDHALNLAALFLAGLKGKISIGAA
jgi:ADP-ribose pyrophosphatase